MVQTPQAAQSVRQLAPRIKRLAARVKRFGPPVLNIPFDAYSTWKLAEEVNEAIGANEFRGFTHAKGLSEVTIANSAEKHVPDREEVCNSPETRLMLAVLEDALATFRRGLNSLEPTERQCFREVEVWLRSGDNESPFSFECICWTLGMDPEYVRAGFYQVKRDAVLNRRLGTYRKLRRERVYDRRVWKGRIK